MGGLRESGGLEADADVILLVHREEMNAEESEHAGTALIIVGKQRAGGQGEVRSLFQGERCAWWIWKPGTRTIPPRDRCCFLLSRKVPREQEAVRLSIGAFRPGTDASCTAL